jgi:phosphopantothenoylcysteine decarboxylase/phosphopantothenate--cysteine ligase
MVRSAVKKIILGVTGGIAAYKAAELCRLLVKGGSEVQVVMTEAALRFVTPLTFQALSGRPVQTSLWDAASGSGMDHIQLSREADLVVVCPATADLLAKMAAGIADDLADWRWIIAQQAFGAASRIDDPQRVSSAGDHTAFDAGRGLFVL